MECDAQRAALDAGAKDLPCPTRRGIIGSLATLVAAASLSQMTVAHDQYEAVLNYFHGEFMSAASRLGAAEGRAQDALYRRMLALATALSVVPAVTPRTWQIKREVADWSFQDGYSTLLLPPDLVAALSPENRP